MIICHCHRVTDRVIRACVRDGANSEESVAEVCGAGTCCGGCVPAVAEIVGEEMSNGRVYVVRRSASASAA
jgi:bacterioferritin-associated ferredoxin